MPCTSERDLGISINSDLVKRRVGLDYKTFDGRLNIVSPCFVNCAVSFDRLKRLLQSFVISLVPTSQPIRLQKRNFCHLFSIYLQSRIDGVDAKLISIGRTT